MHHIIENFRRIMEEIPPGKPSYIDSTNCHFLIEKSKLNILVSDDNFAKSYFNANVVYQVLKSGNSIAYLDVDTVFSAFLMNMMPDLPNAENLILFTPTSLNLEKTIVDICSLNVPYLKLIVIDSLTTFYHLLAPEYDPLSLNRKIGIYLNLLQRIAKNFNIPVIVTSMIRARKSKSGINHWSNSPTESRLFPINDVILKLISKENYIEVSILKHRNISLLGKILLFPIHFKQ